MRSAMSRNIRCVCLLVLLLGLALAAPAQAQEQPLPDQVRGLIRHAEEGMEAAGANQPERMLAEYQELHAIWETFEDQVRAQDPKAMSTWKRRSIESRTR